MHNINSKGSRAISKTILTVIIIMVVVVAGVGTYLYINTGQSKAQLTNVTIGFAPFTDSTTVVIAQLKGFFEQEGINATLQQFAGGPPINQALIGGSINFGAVGVVPFIIAAAGGASIRSILMDTYETPNSSTIALVVNASSPYSSVRDLNGKTIAVHAIGTISYFLLTYWEKEYNVTFSIVAVPELQGLAELASGKIAGVCYDEPFTSYYIDHGGKALVYFPSTAIPYTAIDTIVAMNSYAQSNPAVVKKVVSAVILAARWIMSNRAQAGNMITNYLQLGSTFTTYVLPDWSMNGVAITTSYTWWGQLLYADGTIKSPVNVTSFYDQTYVNQALQSLGTVQDPNFAALQNVALPPA